MAIIRSLPAFLKAFVSGRVAGGTHGSGGWDGVCRGDILLAHYRIHKQGWTFRRAYTEYRRLDANLWDSALLVAVLKSNAGN